MPKFSAFTPFGQLRFSSAPSYVEQWYKLLPRLWGTHLDFTQVGTYDEELLYAVARMFALMQAELEHASNQKLPLKCYDLLSKQELDYQLTPGPNDSILTRQQALAAAMALTRGAYASNVVNVLKLLLGTGFLCYLPNPASTPTVYPASPGSGPGAFKDVRVPAKFLQTVDPIDALYGGGGATWVAYQALDTTSLPTITWSAGATFSAAHGTQPAQTVLPTSVNANGFYFMCTTSGTTGTTEPAWPSSVGSTVTDGSVVWTCVATIAPALVTGDVVVVDAGNTNRMERVTVTGVANTPPSGSNATPGYLYFQATFQNSHDVGARMTTGTFPYWWSTQRANFIVLRTPPASDPPTRQKVNALLAKLLRAVDVWSIVTPASQTPTGGTVGPLTVGSPMGAVPIGTFNFSNSN